jgi:hypothetical protein
MQLPDAAGLRRCRAVPAEPFGDPVTVARGIPKCAWNSRLRGRRDCADRSQSIGDTMVQ